MWCQLLNWTNRIYWFNFNVIYLYCSYIMYFYSYFYLFITCANDGRRWTFRGALEMPQVVETCCEYRLWFDSIPSRCCCYCWYCCCCNNGREYWIAAYTCASTVLLQMQNLLVNRAYLYAAGFLWGIRTRK